MRLARLEHTFARHPVWEPGRCVYVGNTTILAPNRPLEWMLLVPFPSSWPPSLLLSEPIPPAHLSGLLGLAAKSKH
jgi:hypothetical protein